MQSVPEPDSGLEIRQLADAEALGWLASAGSASWRQFPAYSAVAAQTSGAQSRYMLVTAQGEPIALANVRIKRLPAISAGVAMIAQGPVMLRDEIDDRQRALDALYRQLVKREGLSLRINPPIAPPQSGKWDCSSPYTAMPDTGYETFVIDLAPDLNTLRANLHGKWRTDLRRGERGQIEIVKSNDPGDFLRFQPLLSDMADKKGFDVPQDADFFAKVAARAERPETLVIHMALHEGRVIGGHVGAYSGSTAVYLVGATNDEGRTLRASFLLQWAVIEYAKQLGMAFYDLGGVDEIANPDVYRFKKRMGGAHYRGAPMIQARAAWPKGQIVNLAERIYAKVRTR